MVIFPFPFLSQQDLSWVSSVRASWSWRLVQVRVSHHHPHCPSLPCPTTHSNLSQRTVPPGSRSSCCTEGNLALCEFTFLPRFIRGGTAPRSQKSLRKSPISVCSTSPITRIEVVTSKFFIWWGNLNTYYTLIINCVYLHIHSFCMDGFMQCMWGSEDNLQVSVLFFKYVRPRDPTQVRAW